MSVRTEAEFAELERENASLRRMLAENRTAYAERIDHQAATVDVLKAMSGSPGDPQPVFDLIVRHALRACNGMSCGLFEYDGELVRTRGSFGGDSAAVDAFEATFPRPPTRDYLVGRAILDRQTIHIRDIDNEPDVLPAVRAMGGRTTLSMPLQRDGTAIGGISLNAAEPGGFSDAQVELLRTFAEQAVIAITSAETYRALRTRTADLRQSLEYQTATSDVLKVIGRSTFDLQPVLDTLVETAARLCDADQAAMVRRDGDLWPLAANFGFPPEYEARLRALGPIPLNATSPNVGWRAIREGRVIHVPDAAAVPGYGDIGVRLGQQRTSLGVPLLREGVVIGNFMLARRRVEPFTDQQIELVRTFADQAVIAIENTRLLTELREALEQQTATAEVLQTINANPGDLTPVFDRMLETALRLCESAFGAFATFDGEFIHIVATRGVPADPDGFLRQPQPAVPGMALYRVVQGEDVVQIADIIDDEAYRMGNPGRRYIADVCGGRTQLLIALRKDKVLLGVLNIFRQEVQPFTDKQIALLENFADQAVIAIENTRLLTELREALEQQTATAEVLQVINASPGNLAPVFDAVLEKAIRLCESGFGLLSTFDGELMHFGAARGVTPEQLALISGPDAIRPPAPGQPTGRIAAGEDVVHILDARDQDGYRAGFGPTKMFVDIFEARTAMWVALRKDSTLLGLISIYRKEVRAFTARQIALVKNFAAQAVIAMENARLLTEQREALERQTATADVLRVINESPGDLAPVFDAILEKAHTLCGADVGTLTTFDGEHFQTMAAQGLPEKFVSTIRRPFRPTAMQQALVRGDRVNYIPDTRDVVADGLDEAGRDYLAQTGVRTFLQVPLRKDGTLLGFIGAHRLEVRPYSENEIALLENFAAQAVIAMENARLLGELRVRTEQLEERNSAFSERIEHQSATIDVLKTMSASPDDAQPVFDLIVQQARTLLDGPNAVLFEYDGELVHLRAESGTASVTNAAGFAAYKSGFPMVPVRGSISCRAILDREIVHIRDLAAEPGISKAVLDLGHKAQVSIPLMRDGTAVGVISAGSMRVNGISDTQIELLKTFAEQAVIAITSAETYRALQERTAALAQRNSEFGERIEQQAATIDVLKVMSSTPDDTQPVFDQIVRRAKELCNSNTASLFQFRDDQVHFGAMHTDVDMDTPAFASYMAQFPMTPTRGSIICRTILDSRVIHIKDIEDEPGLSPIVRTMIKDGNYRSQVAIPLMRDGQATGCITLTAVKPGGFTDSQIALLRTFAEQAVIAITSVANFRALRERTAELSRSVAELQALEEVLRAVNSSLDLDIVLETIISRAVTLSQADEGSIYEFDDNDEVFVLKATHGMTATRVTRLREARIKLGDTYLGRAGLRREPVHVSDLQLDPTLADSTKEALHDIHAVLAVPLLREDKVLGGLVIRRRTTGDFPTTIPTLLQTFAAQSVLAIENARLFQDARRARLAAEATLTDLRRTQDRLVQTEKMASLGQLTAGIAHEIKNPLNFVNNFSDLSVDLLNELNDAVAPDKLTVAADLRAEIDEITATLKGNLERIAQHGRRADSIVKNMLLHSRTGPSEHREIDLNATVEEALNLAYHGARAETPGFNITLEKKLDPAAGTIDAYPQEFTRVLLNLMSNGFYAARKRAATAPPGFEPTLTVTTRDLGSQVEIRVRDNGTGMPDAVRDKIFEPFFTTKPAGEGTGLGLSLSFDIVVKQHGGQLTVDSEVDTYTEFTVTLPRRVPEGTAP